MMHAARPKAAFLTTRLNLSDALKAVVGARHGKYTTRIRNFNEAGAPTTSTGFTNDDIVTPYVGLLFDLNQQWTA